MNECNHPKLQDYRKAFIIFTFRKETTLGNTNCPLAADVK